LVDRPPQGLFDIRKGGFARLLLGARSGHPLQYVKNPPGPVEP
jgi:hypothetical protein